MNEWDDDEEEILLRHLVESQVTDPSVFSRLLEEMSSVDTFTRQILTGHLLIEERLNEAIENFVFHINEFPELSFYNKVKFAKSICREEKDDHTWTVILAINELRNAFAHSLDPNKRAAKVDKFRKTFSQMYYGTTDNLSVPDKQVLMAALLICQGFLGVFVDQSRMLNAGMKQVSFAEE